MIATPTLLIAKSAACGLSALFPAIVVGARVPVFDVTTIVLLIGALFLCASTLTIWAYTITQGPGDQGQLRNPSAGTPMAAPWVFGNGDMLGIVSPSDISRAAALHGLGVRVGRGGADIAEMTPS